jgi:hypothetical protein
METRVDAGTAPDVSFLIFQASKLGPDHDLEASVTWALQTVGVDLP